MNHVIIGYGYCGFYLAKYLTQKHQRVTTLSRFLKDSLRLPSVNHVIQDVTRSKLNLEGDCILYYLIPPPSVGQQDGILRQFLSINSIKFTKVVYFSSSGVYGDHQGRWVDEQTPCLPTQDRQFRRLDAELLWQEYCDKQGIKGVMLRIAGIYGPDRLPVQAVLNQSALIRPEEAPITNHIYVKDLARLVVALGTDQTSQGVYNVADGMPGVMGMLQQQVAHMMGKPPAPYHGFDQAWEEASPMKREFMQASRRLNIRALQQALPANFHFTPMSTAILESLS
jgi:nucleoside-diphosphate-sugar epimerase